MGSTHLVTGATCESGILFDQTVHILNQTISIEYMNGYLPLSYINYSPRHAHTVENKESVEFRKLQ